MTDGGHLLKRPSLAFSISGADRQFSCRNEIFSGGTSLYRTRTSTPTTFPHRRAFFSVPRLYLSILRRREENYALGGHPEFTSGFERTPDRQRVCPNNSASTEIEVHAIRFNFAVSFGSLFNSELAIQQFHSAPSISSASLTEYKSLQTFIVLVSQASVHVGASEAEQQPQLFKFLEGIRERTWAQFTSSLSEYVSTCHHCERSSL